MNKFYIGFAIVMIGAFATIGQARATGITQTGLAFASNASGNTHKFSGTFNVTINQDGKDFSIVSITPNHTTTTPINIVSAEFFDTNYNADVNVGTATAGGVNSPAKNNWGAGVIGTNGIVGWKTTNVSNYIGGFSTNAFATSSGGYFTAATPGDIGYLTIQLTSSNPIYANDYYSVRFPVTAITPEATSVALFLAGLLPFSLVMWRRTANKLS